MSMSFIALKVLCETLLTLVKSRMHYFYYSSLQSTMDDLQLDKLSQRDLLPGRKDRCRLPATVHHNADVFGRRYQHVLPARPAVLLRTHCPSQRQPEKPEHVRHYSVRSDVTVSGRQLAAQRDVIIDVYQTDINTETDADCIDHCKRFVLHRRILFVCLI